MSGMKKAVVTGASGFIGKALVKGLLADGIEVWAVATARDKLKEFTSNRLHVTVCDFAHYGELGNMIPHGIDWFCHGAWAGVAGALNRQASVQAENILASVRAMEQAQRLGAKKFLFLGSSYQYRMEPITENGRESFLQGNVYGIAKQAAGRMLRAEAARHGIVFNSVLFTNVFGVGDTSRRSTNTMIGQLLEGKDLQLISGEHLHDWTYIDDAVKGMLAVLDRGVGGAEYYIGSRSPMPFRDIITRVRDIVAPDAALQFGCYEDRAYIDYSQIDLERLYNDTGFECQADFDESIRKTANWLKARDKEEYENMNDRSTVVNNPTGGVSCKLTFLPGVPAYDHAGLHMGGAA